MDSNPLVEMHKDTGELILAQCERTGIDITAAFWLKTRDDGQWYLYLSTPMVEDEGLGPAFDKVYKAIRGMDPVPQIDLLGDLKLIGAENPITSDVLAIQSRYGAPLGTVYRGNRLGKIAIEEAYLYWPGHTPARPA